MTSIATLAQTVTVHALVGTSIAAQLFALALLRVWALTAPSADHAFGTPSHA